MHRRSSSFFGAFASRTPGALCSFALFLVRFLLFCVFARLLCCCDLRFCLSNQDLTSLRYERIACFLNTDRPVSRHSTAMKLTTFTSTLLSLSLLVAAGSAFTASSHDFSLNKHRRHHARRAAAAAASPVVVKRHRRHRRRGASKCTPKAPKPQPSSATQPSSSSNGTVHSGSDRSCFLALRNLQFGMLPDGGSDGGPRDTMASLNLAADAKFGIYGQYAQAHSGVPFDGSQLMQVWDDLKESGASE